MSGARGLATSTLRLANAAPAKKARYQMEPASYKLTQLDRLHDPVKHPSHARAPLSRFGVLLGEVGLVLFNFVDAVEQVNLGRARRHAAVKDLPADGHRDEEKRRSVGEEALAAARQRQQPICFVL